MIVVAERPGALGLGSAARVSEKSPQSVFKIAILMCVASCGNIGRDVESSAEPGSASHSKSSAVQASLQNGSFEDDSPAWSGMQRREIEYFAPVDGVAFAVLRPGDDPLQQKTAYIVNQGDQLDLTVWARAVYGDDHVEDLLRSGYDFPPIVTDRGVATVELLAGNTPVATATVDVSPIALQGAPASIPNDDGGNVIVADGYRHSFADHHFVQAAASNPILDPWELATDNDGYRLFTEDLGAVSPVLVGDRHFLYVSAFTETVEDSILVSLLSRHDSANYDWDQSAPQLHSEEAVVLAHMGPNSENPIALAVGKPLTIIERRVALRALFAKKHRRQRSNETPIISPAIE